VAGRFVHLHAHSHYSLLDGAATIDALIDAALREKMPALALTDHGSMFGSMEFYKAALAKGIKPIIGSEAYVAPGSRTDRTTRESEATSHHLTLLVSDGTGYKNLLKLASEAYLTGFYYRPRIDLELLRAHHQGLIALSGCMSGQVARLILSDDMEGAERIAMQYQDLFGKGNFYLEVQDHGLSEQKRMCAGMLALSRKTGIPLVATNDVHYLRRDDYEAHDVMLCINTGKLFEDPKRMRMGTDQMYFKSAAEMAGVFDGMDRAIENTVEIADRCNLKLDLSTLHLPKFTPPDGKTNEQYFEELCRRGLRERFNQPTQQYSDRLNYEIDTIERMKLVDYFLIVWDFVRFAREREIPVGPGRGSVCGSLVAYCLRITDVDPVKYNIIFARFIDIDRKEMPDIDIDFCMNRREEVIDYVHKKYGADCVTQIITFGTMAARGAVRDVGRVLNVPLAEVNAIAKHIPATGVTLKEAIDADPELRQRYEKDPLIRKLFDISMRLEGLARHASVHAAGVLIADRPLSEYIPLYKSTDGEVTSQWDMKMVEAAGMLKMDFLGLRTLTVMDTAAKLIGQNRGVGIAFPALPLDDKKTFALLSHGETKGVFQVESSGFRDLMIRLKPDCIGDIIVMIALYRPGPLGGGMVDEFIARRHGKRKAEYLHPLMEGPLKETYGVMVYQGQIMQLVNQMAGIPMSKALTLIKAISKKKQEEVAAVRPEFIEGCRIRGIGEKIAKEVFDQINFFASYGFNKGHSTAYGLITYQTAYLKANYPVEYMAALLTCDIGNSDKIAEYMGECRRMRIDVVPPDVNTSDLAFTVDGDRIHFGLAAVRNVGERSVEAIIAARKEGGEFKSIYDFCERVNNKALNRTTLESLIKCGAFDSTRARRSQLMAVLDSALQSGARRQQDKKAGQMSMFGSFGAATAVKDDETLPDMEEWPEPLLLKGEKESLGFYVTSHPLTRHEDVIRRFSNASAGSLAERKDGEAVTIGCMVHNFQRKVTKKGKPMAIAEIEDLTGKCKAIFWPETYERHASKLGDEVAAFVIGRVDAKTEEPSVIVSDLIPMEEGYKRLTRRVTIRVDCVGADESTLATVKKILAENAGECPVVLEFQDDSRKTLMKVERRLFVSPSREMAAAFEEALGVGCVTFE
jgi:DNA polymerase-3 subunit alpha